MEQEWLRKASFLNKSNDLKEYLVKAGLAYGTCILPVEYGGNYMDPKMTKVNLDILEGIKLPTHLLTHSLTHSPSPQCWIIIVVQKRMQLHYTSHKRI